MCTNTPLKELALRSRSLWRLGNLQQNYPGLDEKRLRSLFTLYYSDDVDLTLFWRIPASSHAPGPPAVVGHLHIQGINLSLQSPLHKVQQKFSAGKMATASRALYAETVREKKELVNTLMKSKLKEVCPLRVYSSLILIILRRVYLIDCHEVRGNIFTRFYAISVCSSVSFIQCVLVTAPFPSASTCTTVRA